MCILDPTFLSKILSVYDFFGIEYCVTDKMIQSRCGVHQGDNPTALTVYYNQDRIKWYCWSHNCHETHTNNLTGLIQGFLASRYNRKIEKKEAWEWFVNFKTQKQPQPIVQKRKKYSNRKSIIPYLNCPSSYFLKRDFSAELLNDYCIGDHSQMNRAVIPIFDHKNNYVGWTGRSLENQCEKCSFYHNGTECKSYSKWYHSFPRSEVLFNFNNAASIIDSRKVVILTESPGNSLRLIESKCYNIVGMFGTHLSRYQYQLLAKSSAMAVILILDADTAGVLATLKLQEKLKERFAVFPYFLPKGDLADMTVNEIQKKIKPFINKVEKLYV